MTSGYFDYSSQASANEKKKSLVMKIDMVKQRLDEEVSMTKSLEQ